ncbi:DUF397 domain-containing protein [Streptomyces sp. SID11385]|uniref:DUF397 domain-containing protein n=1 Tax=Streptomyces sp. SID11385 TaxID=2706031 RepID=UPI0013CC76B3|nr:DUF397 domain-containing protein [Streptomyces sp. SID11385]NEA43169.1 DUF397 domain-containing protein [Streptomyces sp. SID11385]
MPRRSRPFVSVTEPESLDWHKSTYSGTSNACLEHAATPAGRHAVRDTKDRARGALAFSPESWTRFLRAVA